MIQVPVMQPCLPSVATVAKWLQGMDRAGTYSNFGPLTRELEFRASEFLRVPPDQVVSVANCTLGLEGAVALSPAGSWLVPDFTFAATGLAVLRAGKSLVLGDVDESTWALRGDLARESDAHAGVLPVMPFGAELDLDSWQGRKHVVIDAAASLGTQPDLSCLPATWCVAFSLHATKVLPAGEGGLMVFGDAGAAEQFRRWTSFGFSPERTSACVGTNAKMSEIHAAYALASLEGWERERQDWLSARERVAQACQDSGLRAGETLNAGLNPYWILDCGTSAVLEDMEQRLTEAGIGSRRWWPRALHEMPAFRGQPVVGSGDTSGQLSRRLLGLPMFRGLSLSQARQVAEVLYRAKATAAHG